MRGGLTYRLAFILAVTFTVVSSDSPTLSAGVSHTCAIDISDRVHCWGDNREGQSDVPTTDSSGNEIQGWRTVAASKGGCHTCGVTLSGDLLCWGCDTYGELGPLPTVVGGWVSVAAGKGFTCGIDSVARAVRCWGRFIPQMPGTGPWYGPWAELTAGEDFLCALERDDDGDDATGGIAKCRGWNVFGQVSIPNELVATKWRSLHAGFQHVCGIDSDGTAKCWGSDLFGEVSLVPVVGALSADVDSAAISETTATTTAETQANILATYTETKQVTPYQSFDDASDVAYANRWGSVVAGAHWSCGVLGPSKQIACWGKKRKYTVGGVAAKAYDEFGVVDGVYVKSGDCNAYETLAAGRTHACAILSSTSPPVDGADSDGIGGPLLCWGDDSYGQSQPPMSVSEWRAWPKESIALDLGSAVLNSQVLTKSTCGATSGGSRSVLAAGAANLWIAVAGLGVFAFA